MLTAQNSLLGAQVARRALEHAGRGAVQVMVAVIVVVVVVVIGSSR